MKTTPNQQKVIDTLKDNPTYWIKRDDFFSRTFSIVDSQGKYISSIPRVTISGLFNRNLIEVKQQITTLIYRIVLK